MLYAPHQFEVVLLLDQDPPNMDAPLVKLANQTLTYGLDDLPLQASHFYSPLLIEPPYWAEPEREVTPEDAVQRYFLLEECKP